MLLSYWGIVKRIYWLPLKSIHFNRVDNTGFPKNFLVLMFLFVFVAFLKSYCYKRRISLLLTN